MYGPIGAFSIVYEDSTVHKCIYFNDIIADYGCGYNWTVKCELSGELKRVP